MKSPEGHTLNNLFRHRPEVNLIALDAPNPHTAPPISLAAHSITGFIKKGNNRVP
jgi:hypothetical protein